MASKNKHLMGVCAVYMVKHKPTGKFYIGSSQDLYNRFHSMMSTLKSGRSQEKLQTTFDTTGRNPADWEMTILQQAPKSKLDKLETKYIQQHIYINFDYHLYCVWLHRACHNAYAMQVTSAHVHACRA